MKNSEYEKVQSMKRTKVKIMRLHIGNNVGFLNDSAPWNRNETCKIFHIMEEEIETYFRDLDTSFDIDY